MRRPPSILYRMLLGDLLRLLGVTTVALVAVIAFAGALKPLADGRITLDQALTFMGHLIIPMTQFALPFAAGFAATLTYHRFAAENEAMAASVAGFGHRTLLAPAFAIGLGLAGVLAVMSFELIPPMLRDAQRVLVTDGTRVLASQLNRGESVRIAFGGADAVDLFADRAFPAQIPEPGSAAARRGADRVITLEGVLAVQSQGRRASAVEGAPARDDFASAERVFMFIDEDEQGDTIVELLFENVTTTLDGDSGVVTSAFLPVGPLRLPAELTDDAKFLTWSQMGEATRRPRIMNRTDADARVLAARITERDALDALSAQLERTGTMALTIDSTLDAGRGGEFELEGARLVYDPVQPKIDTEGLDRERAERWARRERIERWRVEMPAGARWLRIVERRTAGSVRTILAGAAMLELNIEQPGQSETVTRFTLRLRDAVTLEGERERPFNLEGEEPTTKQRDIEDLLPVGLDAGAHDERPVAELLAIARQGDRDENALVPRVLAAARNLEERVARQNREILSKRHERLAFSAACLMMVLVGATVAMTLRESLPLPVYLWSFLPALACVVTISAGQRAVYREGAIGLVLLWGGVAAMLVLFLRVYARLRRH